MKSTESKAQAEAVPLRRHPEKHWQLQIAKAQFSEVFRRARAEGPQWVTRREKEAVVILPAENLSA